MGVDPAQLAKMPPLPRNNHMCKQCFNQSWYPQGYSSVPLEFRCKRVEDERLRLLVDEVGMSSTDASTLAGALAELLSRRDEVYVC